MAAATDPDGITTTFSYDPLGRRIAKRSGDATTSFGWDGDVLAFESTQSTAALNERQGQGWSVHYIHERDSFVPLMQIRQPRAMALSETTDVKALMEANGGAYDIGQDPLWNGEQRSVPSAFDRKEMAFYQCDHLGTPQELTDHEGGIAWSAQHKAWGEARETISEAGRRAGFRNPIRFQGQYFDEETGLHYNRYRYYDPDSGRFVSSDPIRLAGGPNMHQYAPNPVRWVDPRGLAGYEASMGNTAAQDTLARGVHVNVQGPGLPKAGGHIGVVPTHDGQGLTTKPVDAATRNLPESQQEKACQCVVDFLNKPKNHSKIAKQAQGGIDRFPGTERAKELEKVRDLAERGVPVK
ncbi:RHS repeat domain-containing protein [Variovorax sp. S12S4]|nr:RHS repeat-associated core domain-containing protein [Variovorax sp. S12S4]